MKNFMEHKKRWLFYCSFFLFLLCATILYFGKFEYFDQKIYERIIQFKNPYITMFFKVITHLGNYPFIIGVILLSFLFFKQKPYGKILTIGMAFILIFNLILKTIFMRERPIGYRMIEEWGYSFPSGHAMASIVFYGLIAYFLSKRKKENIGYIFLLLLLPILIGASRIYLGVHYASDVFAGYFAGIAYLMLFIRFYVDPYFFE